MSSGSGLVHNDFGSQMGTLTSGGGGSGAAFDQADMGTKRAKVLFDYEAVNPNEISVRKEDVRCSFFHTHISPHPAQNKIF